MFLRLRPPSYFCDNETDTGLQLHYRSKRRGFTYYTQGQLKAIAQTFYNQTLEIEVLDSEIVFDTIHVSFKVLFDIIISSSQRLFFTQALLSNYYFLIQFNIFSSLLTTLKSQRSVLHCFERKQGCQQLHLHTYSPFSPLSCHLDQIWSFKQQENHWLK